jgi:hypothetical protein
MAETIGKGYEATKNFNVETGVMAFMGEHAGDAMFQLNHQLDIAIERYRLGVVFEAEFKNQVMETNEKLRDQIAVDKAVTDVINQGAYAMRKAALEAQILQMTEKGLTEEQKKQVILMRERLASEEAKGTGEEIVKLQAQGKAIQAVTNAILQGAEAERRARNEAKYEEMEKAHPGTSDEARRNDERQHQQDLLRDATHITMEHVNRIQMIDEEIKLVDKEIAQGKDVLNMMINRRHLENERLEQLSKQALLTGTARDGFRAFVLEMESTLKKPGQIVYETLTDALSRVSDEITKLFTRQKVSFGKLFQDLGATLMRTMITEGLKELIKIVFHPKGGAKANPTGHPGDAVSTKPDTGLPDGTAGSPFYVWVLNFPDSKSRTDTSTSTGGKVLIGIDPSIPGKSGTAGNPRQTALLDSVAPGAAYLVGDRGPEPVMSQMSGASMSEAMSQRTVGSGGHTYFMSIDARGTDPIQTEQRVYRAIRDAHRDAIGTSVQATVLRSARVPVGT